MTDLEKAKQWLATRLDFGPDVGTVPGMLAAYASHSNSELLERVQKLEQVIDEKLEFARSMRTLCADMNSYGAGWADGAIETLNELKVLAKAPDTRNV